jgi:hypothetical protein
MSWSQTALDNTKRTLRAAPLHPLRGLKAADAAAAVQPIADDHRDADAPAADGGHDRLLRSSLPHHHAIMTRGVVNDVGYMVMLETTTAGPERDHQRQIAADMFGYEAQFTPGEQLSRTVSTPTTVLDRQLDFLFTSQLRRTSRSTRNASPITSKSHATRRRCAEPSDPARTRVTASSADIFVLWMIGPRSC